MHLVLAFLVEHSVPLQAASGQIVQEPAFHYSTSDMRLSLIRVRAAS